MPGINIAGLSLAFAICMVVGLFERSELTFEHFVPNYQDVYRLSVVSHQSFAPQAIELSPPDIAGWLKLDFPSIQYIARLAPTSHSVRHGEVEANERVFWADPDFFRVLPLPAISGDVQNSLERPDSVVLTRAGLTIGIDLAIGRNEVSPRRDQLYGERFLTRDHLRESFIS